MSKSALDVVSEQGPGLPSPDAVSTSESHNGEAKEPPPLAAKLFAVFLISCISFGSHWSSGVTGAMKSTIKKVERGTRAR